MYDEQGLQYRLRGFGGPQGMMTIEHIMDEIAHYLKKDPSRHPQKLIITVAKAEISPIIIKKLKIIA